MEYFSNLGILCVNDESLIMINLKYGITTSKKNVNVDHGFIVKKIKE